MTGFAPPPIAPLQYAPPPPARPRLVIVIGVFSILIGTISALFAISGLLSAAFTLFRTPLPTTPASTTMTTTTTTSPSSSVTTFTYSVSSTSPTTLPTTTAAPIAPFSAFPYRLPRRTAILSIVTSLLTLSLAIVLLSAGILIFRDSPLTHRLHWLFAILKFPLVALAAIVTWWTFTALMSSISSMSPTPFPGFVNIMVIFQVVFGVIISSVYPIILLIVLNTRSWKNHIHSLQSGAIA